MKKARAGDGGVVFLTAVGALSQLLGFGYRVAMSRMVGAEVMGLYQLLMSAYAVVQSLTMVGLTAAVSNLTAQYLARNNSRGAAAVLNRALGLFFLLLAPTAAVTALCSDGISVYLLGDARTRLGLVLLLPCAALTGVENLHKHAFYGAGQVYAPAAVDLAEQCIRAGAVLCLLRLFLPQYPERAAGLIVAGMWVCEVFSSLTLVALTRRQRRIEGLPGPGESRAACRRSIAAIALPVGLNALLGNVLGAANAALIPQKLVEGGMERGEALSAFGVVCGMTVPMLAVPTVFLGAVSLVLTPKLARACALGRRAELGRLTAGAVETVSLLALPAMALMAAVGEELAPVLFRQEGAGRFVLPLAVVMALSCWESILHSVLSAVGRQGTAAAISLMCAGVQAAVTMSTVARLGMAGYVLGAAVSALLGAGLSLAHTLRHTGVEPDVMGWFIMPGLAAVLGGLEARLLLRILRDRGVPALWACAAAAGFGLLLYLAAVQAMGMWPGKGEKLSAWQKETGKEKKR